DQYARGLRRSWRDGKRQKLENLAEEIASGIVTYLAGVKARREEHEQRELEWRREQELRGLARARRKGEGRRREFLRRLLDLSRETDELRSFIIRMRARAAESTSAEVARMIRWCETRLQTLENALTAEAICADLMREGLFSDD